MPAPDPELQRYLATGGEAAFRAMVAEHLGMVLATAARKLGPHAHLAQDVAQAVFTRLARVAQGLPRDLILAPWLHRQAVRLAIDVVRKEERRLRRETSAAMLHAPDSSPGPSNADAALLLDEALDQLPAADRTVLVLRYLEDRDFASVAQSLGSTPEAARKRIARSLEKLRGLLSRRGVVLTTGALTGFLTAQSSQAAPAALAVRMSASALKSAASSGNTAAILTTALMSHAAAVATGALAALLACGLFYQQRKKEIARVSARPVAVVPVAAVDRSAGADGPVEPSIPEPGTLQAIIAALEEITNGPDTLRAREPSEALLQHVQPEQYLEFLISAEDRIHPMRWHPLVWQCLAEWRKVDPASLTAALFESDNRKQDVRSSRFLGGSIVLNSVDSEVGRDGGSLMQPLLTEAFKDWLKVDSASALRWFESARSAPLMDLRIMRGMLLRDDFLITISRHLPFVGEIDDPAFAGLTDYGQRLLRGRWARDTIGDETQLAKVLASADFSPEEAMELARAHASRHAEDCMKTITQMDDGPLRYAAALGLVSNTGDGSIGSPTDPGIPGRLDSARLALTVSGQRPQAAVFLDIVNAWFRVKAGGETALRVWMQNTGRDEASDALAAGARELARGPLPDMEAGLQWAAAIPDAGQRGPLLRGIFLRWQDAEPDTARRFLTSAPPEIADELQPLAALTP